MQCSVCWEDFSLGEKVRKLHCDHLYHEPCIVPWLELHGTCPVCRKSQEPGGGGAEKPAEGAAASSEGGSRSGSADAEAAAAAQSNSQSNNAAGGVAESIRNNLLHMFG